MINVNRAGKAGIALLGWRGLAGCESSCDQQTIDRATAFFDAHQTC